MKEIKRLQIMFTYNDLDDAELYYIEVKSSTYDTYSNLDFELLQKSLTKPEFTVIRMIYYIGYTVAETATYCGVSRQAVNQMRNRALKKLMRVFSEEN